MPDGLRDAHHANLCCLLNSQDKTKTFKPKRKISKNTKRYELHKAAKNTLGSGNLKLAVKLPEREDLNEWLAVNSAYLDIFSLEVITWCPRNEVNRILTMGGHSVFWERVIQRSTSSTN